MKYWVCCCLIPGMAIADSMVVSTQVVGTCVFASPSDVVLDFGSLVAGQGNKPQIVDKNIKFSCTSGMPYKVALDQGQNASTGGKRRMALPDKKDYLPYDLLASPMSGTGQGEGKMLNVKLTGVVAGADYAQASVGEYADVVVLTISP